MGIRQWSLPSVSHKTVDTRDTREECFEQIVDSTILGGIYRY